jgi:hypothetical protein
MKISLNEKLKILFQLSCAFVMVVSLHLQWSPPGGPQPLVAAGVPGLIDGTKPPRVIIDCALDNWVYQWRALGLSTRKSLLRAPSVYSLSIKESEVALPLRLLTHAPR